jgi:hypothetical protein
MSLKVLNDWLMISDESLWFSISLILKPTDLRLSSIAAFSDSRSSILLFSETNDLRLPLSIEHGHKK